MTLRRPISRCGQRKCRHPHLTKRQIEVISLAAAGLPARAIGRRLRISKRTVEDHLIAARQRTGTASTDELIGRCWAAGIFIQGFWPPLWSGSTCVQVAPTGANPGSRQDQLADTTTAAGASGGCAVNGNRCDIGVCSASYRLGPRLGRPPAMTEGQARRARILIKRRGSSVASVARLLGVSRATIYKYIPELRNQRRPDAAQSRR